MSRYPLLVVAMLAGAAAAQERPAQYAFQASVEVDGSSSHYRFALPAAAYRGVLRRDLGDVRIFNAAGEPVPYTFAPREAASAAQRPARLFPLYGEAGKTLDATTLRVARTARGTVVNVRVPAEGKAGGKALLGYLVDASEIKPPKQALLLEWISREGFSGQARVEGSDDLKHWTAVAWSAPVLRLQHGAARLERNRIELPAARAKYLRLSFTGVPSDFRLKEVRVELRGAASEAGREWLSLPGKEGKGRGELVFDTEGQFPVDRLRLLLPQPNTVAEVQFLSRQRSDDPWRSIASATVYRLGGNGEKTAEVRNAEIELPGNADRYWLLKVDQKGGGFGSGEVRLEVGWMPHELVFAARGAAPFVLAYGQRNAKPGALPVATVIPRDADGKLVAARLAKLGAVVEAREPAASGLGYALQFLREAEGKKWLLWAVLVAGVMFLVWMALRLLRDLGEQQAK